jgi:hypothetical protein
MQTKAHAERRMEETSTASAENSANLLQPGLEGLLS